MRRPHLKLVRALDAILLEGGELRERLLLRIRRDLAPLAVHRARTSAASWRLSGANAATARSKRRSAAADESATNLAKLVWLLLLAAAHGAALCGAPMLCELAGGPRRLYGLCCVLEYLARRPYYHRRVQRSRRPLTEKTQRALCRRDHGRSPRGKQTLTTLPSPPHQTPTERAHSNTRRPRGREPTLCTLSGHSLLCPVSDSSVSLDGFPP